MLPNEFGGRNESGTLSEFIALLRESCATIKRIQGGDTYYIEEVEIFKQIAKDQGYFLDQLPELQSSPCDDSGNEHEVWFSVDHSLYIKATWPDHFGTDCVES